MADIQIDKNETLELDTIIQKSSVPSFVSFDSNPSSKSRDNILSAFETQTTVFDPPSAGEYILNINGQELIVDVIDPTNGIIDNFEDGSLSVYDTSNGSNIYVTSDHKYKGTYSLEIDVSDDTSGSGYIISKSGLQNYPTRGDTFSWWWKMDGTNGIKNSVYFNWIDENNYYSIGNNQSNGGPNYHQVNLSRVTEGSTTTIASTGGNGSFKPSANTWYEFEVSWTDDDQFDLKIKDTDGSVLASGSGSDNNPLSLTDGIRFYGVGNLKYGSDSNYVWIDYMRIK